MSFFTGKPGDPLDFALRLRGDGRYGLTDRFGYQDPGTGKLFFVPRFLEDFSTDGSSAPAAFSWLVPSIDTAAPASVLHDALVVTPKNRLEHIGAAVTRSEADRIFMSAMRELDVSFVNRHLMWAAVRVATIAESRAGKTFLFVAFVLAVCWPSAAAGALRSNSVSVAAVSVVIVLAAAAGTWRGGDLARPLCLAVLVLPLLVPASIVVMVSLIVARTSDRLAGFIGGERIVQSTTVMAADGIPARPPPPVEGRVFMSYSHLDRLVVEPWRDALVDDIGADVWWDKQLVAGNPWRSEILDELGRADCIVVFWSQNSSKSKFIMDVEVKEALRRDVLVPVVIDDTPLSGEVAETHAVMLHNDVTGEGWNEFRRAVRTKLESA